MGKNNAKIFFIIVLAMVLQVSMAVADAGLSASISKYEPYPASPGQTLRAWILLENTGDVDAKDVTVEVVEQRPFSLYGQETGVKKISILGSQKDYLVDFNLKVDDDAVQGTNYLKIRYRYAGGIVEEKNLEIDVQERSSTVSIAEVSVEPERIPPGSDGKVTITVRNDAPTFVTDLSLKLQLQALIGSTLVDLPFAPINSGSEKKIYSIAPGETDTFEYILRVYPETESKVYKIPFTLTYYDSVGNEKNKTDYIGIVVNDQPDVTIAVEETELLVQKRSGEVRLKVINKGLSDIKFLNVILEDSEDYELLSSSNAVYVGNLVSDDYQTVDYILSLKSDKNAILMPVTLQYRDANNKYYENKVNVPLNLIDGEKLSNGNGSSGVWIFVVLIVVIIAGIWYWKFRHKKNKKGQF